MNEDSSIPQNEASRECRNLFAPLRDESLPRGTMVGRFVLINRIGAGAMGVVYAAYDPDLDRKVALKLVLASGDEPGDARRQGLLREAQALARLTHPNVVAVHDVYMHDSQVWIAMEYVSGHTLADWAAEKPRAWHDITRVLTGAASGVAAAHAAGVIHRDLKPDNVMIGSDGRVRVMDFGLAHGRNSVMAAELEVTDPARNQGESRRAGALEARLTQPGAIPGTPAYMAPEQWDGHDAGPPADQFAWSVMAWELLYGERPFAGETVAALSKNVLEGRRRHRPRGRRVPGWLRQVIERGLSTEPARRWPSMAALLAALSRGRVRVRMRIAALIVTGVAAIGAGVEGYRRWDLAQKVSTCAATRNTIDELWNDEARQKLRGAFASAGVSYADVAVERSITQIDQYVAAWRDARAFTCLSADVYNQWDQDLRDRALWCLEDKHLALKAVLHELGEANAMAVQRSVPATATLRPVRACIDGDLLRRQPRPPKEGHAVLAEVRVMYAHAYSLAQTGDYKQALGLAIATREQAATLGWPPLTAAARALEGFLLEKTGVPLEAERASTEAYFEATRSGAWEVAANAALDLIYIVGHKQARHADGRAWARHAQEVAIAHAGDPEELLESKRLKSLASVQEDAGAYAEALALNEQALAIRIRALGADHPDVGNSMSDLARVHNLMGAYPEARELFDRALVIFQKALGPDHPYVATGLNNAALVLQATGAFKEAAVLLEHALYIREKALGADHPEVAASLNNLGAALYSTGEYADAAVLMERALEISERKLGPDHPTLASRLSNLGAIYWAMGAYRKAAVIHERALAIREKGLGPDHPDVAVSLNNLALVLKAIGEYKKARDMHERALSIREKALGPDHPEVASSLNNLAVVCEKMGDYAAVRGHYERAIEILQKARGPDHPEVAMPLYNLAKLDSLQGKHRDAIRHLERAVAILGGHEGVQSFEPEANFNLAKALIASGSDRHRAIAVARTARDQCREAGESKAADLAQVEQWLKDLTDGRLDRRRGARGH